MNKMKKINKEDGINRVDKKKVQKLSWLFDVSNSNQT
jgi:hypothetical protein